MANASAIRDGLQCHSKPADARLMRQEVSVHGRNEVNPSGVFGLNRMPARNGNNIAIAGQISPVII